LLSPCFSIVLPIVIKKYYSVHLLPFFVEGHGRTLSFVIFWACPLLSRFVDTTVVTLVNETKPHMHAPVSVGLVSDPVMAAMEWWALL
jgi:hypothetical protein